LIIMTQMRKSVKQQFFFKDILSSKKYRKVLVKTPMFDRLVKLNERIEVMLLTIRVNTEKRYKKHKIIKCN
jgi:hypothetical protein